MTGLLDHFSSVAVVSGIGVSLQVSSLSTVTEADRIAPSRLGSIKLDAGDVDLALE